MTRRRFHAPPEAFTADAKSASLSADETHHLREVLRLNVGDEIFVFDGEGREFRCEIAAIDRTSAQVTVMEAVRPAHPEPPLHLTLAVALLKGEKFDLVAQKATELGIASLIPIITARADVKIKSEEDAHRKLARWRRIVLEATKQCGRARLLKIAAPISFRDLIDQSTNDNPLRVMFAERAGGSFDETFGDKEIPNNVVALIGSEGGFAEEEKPNNVVALIGSEGGFADEEIEQAREGGWKIVTLGGRIMRAETAAIAIAAILQHRFGDLK